MAGCFMMYTSMGSMKAAVLPEPVSAGDEAQVQRQHSQEAKTARQVSQGSQVSQVTWHSMMATYSLGGQPGAA
jgi:hypothetical protein